MKKNKIIKRMKKNGIKMSEYIVKLEQEIWDLETILEDETAKKNVAEATLDLVRYQIRELDNTLGEKA